MVKMLCVHGVGHEEATPQPQWQADWTAAIQAGVHDSNADVDVQTAFVDYDGLFQPVLDNLTAGDVADAFFKLAGGAVGSDLAGLFNRPRAMANFSETARWTAGMVVAWVENDQLRADSRQAVLDAVAQFEPDIVCAHSLGSLISYDAFRHNEDVVAGKILVTLGSQLGNHFVKGGAFGGRIDPFAGADFWFHLYNPNDHVFTEQLQLGGDNFRQVVTAFGAYWAWALNHDAAITDQPLSDNAYLSNSQTRAQAWPRVALKASARSFVAAAAPAAPAAAAPPGVPALAARAFRLQTAAVKTAKAPETPNRRALLVGVNAYPDAANRLEGCVNDVFLISSVLQECGFAAEDIRVVLDDRATSAAILERLHWLLEGTDSGDTRFFFYSGHGAQLPAYGPDGKINHIDACLAPYDFAWTRETAVTDDRIVDLYGQLPYDVHLMMVFDSCYSGGLTRGTIRIRGLAPPDDIRHRMLRWDARRQMWVVRDLPPANPDLAASPGGSRIVGASGATRLLGRAVSLRTLPAAKAERLRGELKHQGPYLPVVYEACGEQEMAYEYRHGATSYGAFTYSLAAILRRRVAAGQTPTYEGLLDEAAATLQALQYEQHPIAVGPKPRLEKPVPWQGG